MARRKEFEGRLLAILNPELRHSSPSKRQSAALIGSLAVIALVVSATVPARRSSAPAKAPVAMVGEATHQTPSDFTPHDVPKPSQPVTRLHCPRFAQRFRPKKMSK